MANGHNYKTMDDEQKVEQEALKIDEAAIKAEIITETGLDEVDDADKIDKIVAREVKQRTFTSKAIASKIKTREELEILKKTPSKPQENNGDAKQPEWDKLVGDKLNEALEKRDLDTMDYPDELKKEIHEFAKFKGISVKQAVKEPYLESRIEDMEKKQKADEASIGRKNKSGGKKVFDANEPPDVDVSTPEGRKEWEEWKAAVIKQG